MKVLFFQPYLAAWRIEFLDRFIREFKGEVVVVDGGHSDAADGKSVSSNVADFPVQKLRSANRLFSYIRFPYPVYLSPGLILLLLRERPDVIVTEGEINILNNISILLYSILSGVPYLWWSLGKVRTNKTGLLPKILRPVVNILLWRAKYIVARNSFAKKYYRDLGIKETKIVIAPNSMDESKARGGVDLNLVGRLESMKSGPVVLYSGALTVAKRPADLIEAVRILETQTDGRIRAEVWFIGDGPERRNLEVAAAQAGLSQRVHFFGRVIEGVGSFFTAADVVVVPGLGGLVINHAMIFGVPVVSRSADGTELDLVEDERSGFIVPDDSNKSLADAIEKVLHCNRDGRMSRYAERKVDEQWNMKIMITRFEGAIRSAMVSSSEQSTR